MKNKLLLLCFGFCLLTSFKSYAQESDDDSEFSFLTAFVGWVKKIDVMIADINNKETLRALDRHLGYARLHIEEISNGKLLLAREIKDLKADMNKNKHLPIIQKELKDLLEDIEKLNFYLKRIKGLLSQTNHKAIDDIIREIDKGFNEKKGKYIKNIETAINKNDIPYDRILKDAVASKTVADQALEEIKVAKGKIMVVLTK